MHYQPTNQGKTLQQFQWLSRQLNHLMESNRFLLLTEEVRAKLIERLRSLYTRLAHARPQPYLRRVLGSAAVLLGLGLSPAMAQVPFAPVLRNPFGIQPTSDLVFSSMVDVDGDGDLDILAMTYDYTQALTIYRNTGTPQSPNFAAPAPLPAAWNVVLPDLGEDGGLTTADFSDLDGDGDRDLIIGSYQYDGPGKIFYLQNTGTAQAPNFAAPQENPFGFNAGASSVTTPKLVDIDGDGDLDLFSVRYDIQTEDNVGILFQRNTGTPQAPAFSAPEINPFGFDLSTQLPFMAFGDIDNDGDLDMLTGGSADYYGDSAQFSYISNTGTAQAPNFGGPAADYPFGFESTNVGDLLQPLVGDLDADGDTDILIWGVYDENTSLSNWFYLRNLLNSTAVGELEERASLKLYPTLSRETIQLEIGAQQEQAFFQIEVFDTKGQLMSSRREAGSTQLALSLPVHQLAAGTYLMRITTDQGQAIKPFIKQ